MESSSLMPPNNQTIQPEQPIDSMLKAQANLSEFLGVYKLDKEEQLRSTLAQLSVEASEALAPFLTKTKPWKTQTPDLTATDEEVIDILHYVWTYFNIRGMSQSQIVELYFAKNARNFARVAEKMAVLQQTSH